MISLFERFVPRDLFEIVTKKISKITVRKIILSNIYYKALATATLMLVQTVVFFLSLYVWGVILWLHVTLQNQLYITG